MVWLPDHIWEKQKKERQQKGKGKGWGGGGGANEVASLVLNLLLKQGSGGGNWGGGWGRGSHWTPPKIDQSDYDKSGGELGEHTGTICKTCKKFSFISCDTLKQAGYDDAFVLASEMKAYKEGQKVKFTAYVNKEGKVRGMDLKSGVK
mmetsp:Transcript_115795/g.183072  ORF Transcript_115795/g.183072 Transcript_115795/m.183072 type:complete len:148 (+) Transcript_115795:2-445(+)